MEYIIIGNGVAGTEAAMTIRKNDSEGKIRIVSESQNMFYYRPRIIDFLADEITAEKLTIYKDDFYEKKNIECMLETKVLSIDAENKTVKLEGGENLKYDKLLLAPGANCFLPPINGSDKTGVFTLKSIQDGEKIKEYCANIKSVIFIGGGLLGLETACSLLKPGQKGTIIEFFPRLLPRQLDKDGAAFLQKRIEDERGLEFILGDSVEEIIGDGVVTGVKLKSGKEISCEAIIVSAGIRARTELGESASLTIDRGILANDNLETSHVDIYCAGDALNHRGRTYGIWGPSKEQGKIAGLNMCGIETIYEGSTLSAKLKVSGHDLFSMGFDEKLELEELIHDGNDYYLKIFKSDGKIVGAIVIGSKEIADTAEKCSSGRCDYSELEKYI